MIPITHIKNNIRVSLPNQTLTEHSTLVKPTPTDLFKAFFKEIKFFMTSVDGIVSVYTNNIIPRISLKFQSKDPTDYYTPVIIYLLVDSETKFLIKSYDQDQVNNIYTLNPISSIVANFEEAFNFILNYIRKFWSENYDTNTT